MSRNRILLTALDIMRAVARREVRANLERLLRELADLIITHERDFKEEIEMFLKMSILYILQVGKVDNTEIKEILIDGRDEKLRTIIDELMEEGLQQGSLRNAQDMVLLSVETKEGYVPLDIERKIREITDCVYLKELLRKIIKEENVLEMLRREFFKE